MNKMESLPQRLERILKKKMVATVDEMAAAVQRAQITVKQALAKLDYLTSYNHNCRFYALRSVARFDRDGIWRHRKASFTRYGTLADLLVALVDGSPSGCTAAELTDVTAVTVGPLLAELVQNKRLMRLRQARQYVYFSARSKRDRARQMKRRFGFSPSQETQPEEVSMEHLKRTIVVLLEIIRSQPKSQVELRERLRQRHPEIAETIIGQVCRQYDIQLKKN